MVKENKEPATKQDGIDQQPVLQDHTSVGGTATTLAESNPSLVTESSTFPASKDSVTARSVKAIDLESALRLFL